MGFGVLGKHLDGLLIGLHRPVVETGVAVDGLEVVLDLAVFGIDLQGRLEFLDGFGVKALGVVEHPQVVVGGRVSPDRRHGPFHGGSWIQVGEAWVTSSEDVRICSARAR